MILPLSLRRWLPLGICCGLALVILLIALSRSSGVVLAQQNGLSVEKTLLKSSQVVQVGETVTFAITITNLWDTTVITLPVIDDYDESVLRFLDATPAQDTHIAASGVISWENVLATTGPLAPGQQIVIYLRFVAEHPTEDLRVVNRAETHDAYDSLGRAVANGSSSAQGESVGGNTPITKTLAMSSQPVVGMPVTFTITIRNDGRASIVNLPVRDTYDPNALQFWRAIPPPDAVGTGVLTWSNVLQPPLPSVLAPGEEIQMTVVFTALQALDQTTNRAEVLGAEDSYGNDLAPAADDAPIRVVPGPSATAVPTLTPTTMPTAVATAPPTAPAGEPKVPIATATPTAATPTVLVTSVVSVTATLSPEADSGISTVTPTDVAPASLPHTAASHSSGAAAALLALVAFVLAGLGLRLVAGQRRR